MQLFQCRADERRVGLPAAIAAELIVAKRRHADRRYEAVARVVGTSRPTDSEGAVVEGEAVPAVHVGAAQIE